MILREKPALPDAAIANCLTGEYGLTVDTIIFLPIGYDPNAAVYRIQTQDGSAFFLKLTRNAIVLASLRVPRTLLDCGITNVLAPLPTLRNSLWCSLAPYNLILYPFIPGENAMTQGMSDQQWITFGKTLNAIHGSGVEMQMKGEIEQETYVSPVIALVRSLLTQVQAKHSEISVVLPIQQEFATFLQQNAALILHLTDRAERLGYSLQSQNFDMVLCHGDIHAANIMVDCQGEIYLIDWDTPRIAPRERDLLFIAGSVIARRVTTHEESCFFLGYGATLLNWQALAYYRYERALEDIYEGGRSVFLNPQTSAAVKEADARLTRSLFGPDNIVHSALEADSRSSP